MPDEWIEPTELPRLRGDERFTDGDATVDDFWKWAFNDLRLNIVRGTLAEFLVARCLGLDTSIPKKEWENFDLVMNDGTKIEVKSSGYWQSWKQKGPSSPSFSGLITRKLIDDTNAYTENREVWADVYVFALQACEDPEAYNPLDVAQWQFWVAPAETIRRENRQGVSLSWVRRNATGPLTWGDLASAVPHASASESVLAPELPEGSVWVPGEPVLFMGKGESDWKAAIQAATETATYAHPRFVFRVAAFKRRGHYFDLDNLVKPAMDQLPAGVETIWASVHEGEEPGVEISNEDPPPPPTDALLLRLEDPPQSSVRREVPAQEVVAVGQLGTDEAVGIDIAFDGPARIADFGFTGPIKPLIDLLGPMLGVYGHGAADYRIRELRVRRGSNADASGVSLTAWLLEA